MVIVKREKKLKIFSKKIFSNFYNHIICITIYSFTKPYVVSFLIQYQLVIVCRGYLIFFEIFEIFLDAVFLFMVPDLATCMRID